MSDLVSRLHAAVEAKNQKAQSVLNMGVLLDWPRRNGKATLRAFLEDNDPVTVVDRCEADRRIVNQCTERRDGFVLAQFVLAQLAFVYGISVEEETTGE